MFRIEKTDPITGTVSAIEVFPNDKLDFVVTDDRARLNVRSVVRQFCDSISCKALIHTERERADAAKRAQRDAK